MAVAGETGMMPVVRRISDRPYKWEIAKTPASEIANRERRIPRSYITRDGYHITEPCRRYLQPLIVGEAPVKYRDGLPVHVSLKGERIKRRLPRRSA
jgi:6-phosphofructokinase 1